MKLPFLYFVNRREKSQYYLALVLRDEKVSAVVFEELEGKATVIGKGTEYFKHSIEDAALEEFLDVLDKAISTAEEPLPQNIETKKTIFGVKDAWVSDNKIKTEYLLKLKRVSDELGLIPIGFLVTSEAIIHLLQKEEGVPISAILVETGKKSLTVSSVRSGKIIETRASELMDGVAVSVDALLKHFTASEILPSRIIIFNGGENLTQEFVGHLWSKNLPFLHLPQITNLLPEFDAKAVLFGASTQMGFEILKDKKEGEAKQEEKEMIQKVEKEKSMEYFGFIEEGDVAKNETVEAVKETHSFGDIGKQIAEIPKEQEFEETQRQPVGAPIFLFLNGIKSILAKLPKLVRLTPVKPSFAQKNFMILGLIIIVVVSILIYMFTASATIVLTFTPKNLARNQDVTFTNSSSSSLSDNLIPAEFVSVDENGTLSTSATGKKEVGTMAKGKVTVFNNSSSPVRLDAGTTLVASTGLDFTLDNGVVVASASGDIFTGTTPGKADVSVTAGKIGTEYNLPSNTKFSIGGSLSVAAKNANPFTGGTKKDVTVVSSNDLNRLLEDFPKSLEEKAKADLARRLSKDQVLLPIFVEMNFTKKSFDKNAGDEGNKVTLSATISYQTLSYKRTDLVSFANKLLKKGIGDKEVLDEKNIKMDVKGVTKKSNRVIANLTVKALLLPKIDEEALKKEVAGKSFKNAQEIMLKLPQVSRVDISSSLNIPFLPKILPLRTQNVKIEQKTSE